MSSPIPCLYKSITRGPIVVPCSIGAGFFEVFPKLWLTQMAQMMHFIDLRGYTHHHTSFVMISWQAQEIHSFV
jgi:hypothetical protein